MNNNIVSDKLDNEFSKHFCQFAKITLLGTNVDITIRRKGMSSLENLHLDRFLVEIENDNEVHDNISWNEVIELLYILRKIYI